MLGAGRAGGNRAPIDVRQPVAGNDAALGVDVLGKVVLHPERGAEMGGDPIRELLIPPGRVRVAGQRIQRRDALERIGGVALRDAVVFDPRGRST